MRGCASAPVVWHTAPNALVSLAWCRYVVVDEARQEMIYYGSDPKQTLAELLLTEEPKGACRRAGGVWHGNAIVTMNVARDRQAPSR